ncbi:MAG: DNA phosphorothioation-associated putative methyltransferase [Nostoc sp. EfeVER01]|uniref:DNA phosphorothioation-associated putative methyltransferase n=1 Tax=unclassified Nostoc TaxID=2593658 RepID=UPI002AD4C888|nr:MULTISPECIES: DNA phosphorothioation-associated putative methyltransferase [unclassified Nostoc]MDZ7944210.1 DNA phosphorothioation-associated putative methyltransferase [Nostoc sp. EfeVER01]MDZ7996177.1 DNA phosphorothioation-associated putative methyltransferase [Nostoc sp. EspVER01]
MPEALEIERHRAAIARPDISRPVRLAIEGSILNQDTTFFDYGCGYGGDVERVKNLGYTSAGWDPYYHPDVPRTPADVVNLGYVLNVIEDSEERRQSLIKAWELTGKVLIVAAQILINAPSKTQLAYNDGIVTRRNTFQKYYEQQELKTYIDEVLNVDAVPIALGVYFVFRDEAEKESYKAIRFFSTTSTPRVRIPIKRFEDYQEQLQPLMAFFTKRGRLPVKGELENEQELLSEFGNFRRAFSVILQATDEAEWDAIAYRRSLDIQVYLALTHFDKRPAWQKLAPEMRHDIKAFFSSYEEACLVADQKLFSLGKPGVIKAACEKSKIGKHTRGALYVHVSALAALDPVLRICEGCASRTIGRIDEATLIKYHTDKPQISYLSYPEFDTDPHPALKASIGIDLKTLFVTHRDYETRANPPILHRKETFVTSDYPGYEEFAKLTQQEQELGLLNQKSDIGTREGWEKCLAAYRVEIRGHQVYPIQES